MVDVFPMVPLAPGQALGVAIMSYNGRINFGLLGDYDALYDLDELAEDFGDSLADLAGAAGVKLSKRARRRARRFDRPTAAAAATARSETDDTVT
jgi:hypothetical protein